MTPPPAPPGPAAEEGIPDGLEAAEGPGIARVYDYMLGGSHNFAADRAAARQFLAQWPDAQLTMLANRAFLGRAVRYLSRRGRHHAVPGHRLGNPDHGQCP